MVERLTSIDFFARDAKTMADSIPRNAQRVATAALFTWPNRLIDWPNSSYLGATNGTIFAFWNANKPITINKMKPITFVAVATKFILPAFSRPFNIIKWTPQRRSVQTVKVNAFPTLKVKDPTVTSSAWFTKIGKNVVK